MEQTKVKTKKLIINLFGGPGCGKSTVCAGLFFELKLLGYNTEMAREYAKDLVYTAKLENTPQKHITQTQIDRQFTLMDYGVDVIITDAPIKVAFYYGEKETGSWGVDWWNFYLDYIERSGYRMIDVKLNRVNEFKTHGRIQNESEAIQIDKEMDRLFYFHFEVNGDRAAVNSIVNRLKLLK